MWMTKMFVTFFTGTPGLTTPAKMQLHQILRTRQSVAFSLSCWLVCSRMCVICAYLWTQCIVSIVAGRHYRLLCIFYKSVWYWHTIKRFIRLYTSTSQHGCHHRAPPHYCVLWWKIRGHYSCSHNLLNWFSIFSWYFPYLIRARWHSFGSSVIMLY